MNNITNCHEWLSRCQDQCSDEVRSKVLINEVFGYCGASGVSLILIPQVAKTYREKNVSGISLTFLLLNLWTSSTFLIYGVLEDIWPMILSNIVSLICCCMLLVMYCSWKRPVIATSDHE